MKGLRGLGTVGVFVLAWVASLPAAGKVVISEFRTRGPAGGNDEFIELYNAGDEAVDIGGYKVKGSNSTGAVGVRATIPPATVMAPRTFYLLVNTASSGYSGTVQGDQNYTTGITDDGGLALTNAADEVLDAIGMSTGSAFQEGANLAKTTTNKEQSYERKTATCGPDKDTDNNAEDFLYNDGLSRPQNSSSCRLACAGGPCVTPPAPFCKDPGTSVQYGTGTCVNGQCEYGFSEVVCEFGCDPMDGLCSPDPCEGVVCNDPPNTQCYEATGTCKDGACEYAPLDEETPCDDGNLCTEGDQCDGAGHCLGSPKFCYVPDPECVDPDTSRLYRGGACEPATGECVFTYDDTTCKFGCDEQTGLCANDPCAGVVCQDPPNSQCWEAIGRCVGGTCEYAVFDTGTPCDDGNRCTSGDHCRDGLCIAGTPITCNAPPNAQCYQATGTCVDGICVYTPLDPSTPCDDRDPCTESDACNAKYECVGAKKVCAAPAPVCIDPRTSHLEVDPACDPADGECRGAKHHVDCAELGCDEAYGTCNRMPVISQFRTRGPAGGNDEFVEVFNPSAFDVDIGGWTLRGSNAAGIIGVRAKVPLGTVMGPRTFYLFVNTASSGYSGTVAGDLGYGTGIVDTGGVALADAAGTVIDAVGMSAGSAYLEGAPLTAFTVNKDQAYERKTLACGPDRDLDDNASDFKLLTSSHPRNSASCRLECAGDPCVNPPAPWCEDEGTLNTYPGGECSGDGACGYPMVPVTCEFGCDAGACKPGPCEGVVCNDPPNTQCFEATGTCSEGVCSYEQFETGTDCDDGDKCTRLDHCDIDGTCAGAPVICPAKGPECLDGDTSRTYTLGSCDPDTGECVYEPLDTTCDFGCDEGTGLCLGDLCAGVVCDDPPSICHAPEGVCSGGACWYAPLPAGVPCDDGDACTQDDECDGAGVCAGREDPDCVQPPDAGEDTGPTDGLLRPDDGAVTEPAPEEEALPDKGPDNLGWDVVQTDATPEVISLPDMDQDGVIVDTAGRDAGADAGTTQTKGGGWCSSARSSPSGWWFVLVVLGLLGIATRRREPRT